MGPAATIRVLVVDDSAFMRTALSMILNGAPGIEVIGTARDGIEARQKVEALSPDVVTLDVEMPRMDGLTALRHIMEDHPVPVIMVSSITREGASATLDALQAGALDFVPKEPTAAGYSIDEVKALLIQKVRAVAGRRLPRPRRREPASVAEYPSLAGMRLLAIGSSTGGPFALQEIIPQLPPDYPIPVVIAQHMPPQFTRSLAERLHRLSALEVKEADDGDAVHAGRVLVAPGGRHLVFESTRTGVFARVTASPHTLHRPSVDVMLDSASDAFGGRVAAVILTGMGNDGRDACIRLHERRGRIIAQDEPSSVVYGMPRCVAEAGVADAVLPLSHIAAACSNGLLPASARRRLADVEAAPIDAQERKPGLKAPAR